MCCGGAAVYRFAIAVSQRGNEIVRVLALLFPLVIRKAQEQSVLLYENVCVCMYAQLLLCMCTFAYVCENEHKSVRMHMCGSESVCRYVYSCICIWVCM